MVNLLSPSSVLFNPLALAAALTWPKFSLTSYKMISGLVAQGIIPHVVIDVGANVGQFAVAAAKLFPACQIYSFEPLPSCYKLLTKHIASLPQIKTFPFALGDHPAKLPITINSHTHSSSLLPLSSKHLLAFPGAQPQSQIDVEVSTIDQIFSKIPLSDPTLLKIDAQGYEMRIIQGASETLKRIHWIILEVSFKELYEGELVFHEVLPIMHDLGFQFLRPVGWLRDPRTDEILQMDALFTRYL